ncbi:response regulator [Massilia sp. UYP11]|uniref:response regulator n=1 Tax=Massilia sp. UYP11 TaxID=1756385 RepID=UPI003D1B9D2A
MIADDHQLVREGVKKVLSTDSGIAVVGEAADLPSAIAVLASTQTDVFILDLSLGNQDELEALRTTMRIYPAMRVLVLSSHSEERFGIAVLRLGAAGYLWKSRTADEVVTAVCRVHSGGRYLSDTLADLLAREIASPEPRHPHDRLTERELQVLRLLATGCPVKQIAGRLDISISSVNTYRGRIFLKLELKNNADLVRYALQHGMIA